jgi:hypothetical protein
MEQVYIATYHEDNKKPVEYYIDENRFKEILRTKTEEEAKEYFLTLLRQSKRHGWWSADGSMD